MKNLFKRKLLLITTATLSLAIIYLIGAPHLRLVGVHNNELAIIEDTDKGIQDVFKLGGNVFFSGQLSRVDSDHVTIMKEGKKLKLPLKAGISIKDISDNKNINIVNRFKSTESLKRIPFHFLSTKTVPVVENKKIVGVALKDISKDSPLIELGFRNGDVIKSVDGKLIRGTFEALDLIRRSGNDNIPIELERNGNTKTIILS